MEAIDLTMSLSDLGPIKPSVKFCCNTNDPLFSFGAGNFSLELMRSPFNSLSEVVNPSIEKTVSRCFFINLSSFNQEPQLYWKNGVLLGSFESDNLVKTSVAPLSLDDDEVANFLDIGAIRAMLVAFLDTEAPIKLVLAILDNILWRRGI